MFSAHDAEEVFQMLALEGELSNPLMVVPYDAYGYVFITRKYVRQAFRDLVISGCGGTSNQRASVYSLAQRMDISSETIIRLAEESDDMILVHGSMGHEIITKSVKDSICQDLEANARDGIVSKDAFAQKHGLKQSGLDTIIKGAESQIFEVNGYFYSSSYGSTVSKAVADTLREHIQNLRAATLRSTDFPGRPPSWFIQRTIHNLLEKPEFEGQLYIHGLPRGVQCTPIRLIKQTHDTIINHLHSGEIAYIDVESFQRDHFVILPSVDEARTDVGSREGIELVGSYAISEAWISNFSKECLKSMAQDGDVDFGQPVIANFPDSIYSIILEKVEHTIRALSPSIHRAGEALLSEDSYSRHRGILLDLAKADASSQWQRIKEAPGVDAKYSLSSTFYQLLEDNPILQNLVKERALERAIDDAFSARISELEKQNEVEFVTFWTDRVVARVALYSEGLTRVEDQKLQDQLSDLLAQYIQTDLVPDALSKASSQALLLSRKTRKNAQRLEAALDSHSMDVPALISSLDKFGKKQSIDAVADLSREPSKSTMLNDMARRMQKQKKSDGPLLFLTLVVFLFAKHNAGVVYATGKYAPKLMKQLRSVLDAEQYSQLEAWKEAARAGSLRAEDRDGMKKMVEAGI